MAKNLVRKQFTADTTWTAPAGVKEVIASIVYKQTQPQTIFGLGFSAMLLPNGECWTMGAGANGQLGDGTTVTTYAASYPVRVVGNVRFRQVSQGGNFAGGITYDGNIWMWGTNVAGQLGTGTVTSTSSPVPIVGLNRTWRQLACGTAGPSCASVAIDSNGDAYAWGSGTGGMLGDGTSGIDRSSPTLVVGGYKWQMVTQGFQGGAGLTTAGDAYSWGAGTLGRLGDGTTVGKSSPVPVLGGKKFTFITGRHYHTLAIDTNGDGWGWGSGSNGQLGNGASLTYSSPQAILGGYKWKQLFSGYGPNGHTCGGITTDGDAYCWGYNGQGQCGDGTLIDRSSPVPVLGGLKWKSLDGFYQSVGGVAEDGTRYAWGANFNGELGVATTTKASSPIAVVGPSNWEIVDARYGSSQRIAVVPGTAYAVKVLLKTLRFERNSIGNTSGNTLLQLEYYA